jgi:hypothetical protein
VSSFTPRTSQGHVSRLDQRRQIKRKRKRKIETKVIGYQKIERKRQTDVICISEDRKKGRHAKRKNSVE